MAERPLIRRPFQPLRSFLFFLFSSGKKGGVFRRRNYLAFAVNALITADNCSFSDSPSPPLLEIGLDGGEVKEQVGWYANQTHNTATNNNLMVNRFPLFFKKKGALNGLFA